MAEGDDLGLPVRQICVGVAPGCTFQSPNTDVVGRTARRRTTQQIYRAAQVEFASEESRKRV